MGLRNIMKLIVLIVFLTACQSEQNGGTTTGNPQTVDVTLQLSSYSVANASFLNWLIAPAYAGINSLSFCFKRLRFKKDDQDTAQPETSEDNIDFDLGEVDIDSSGTFLSTVSLPKGHYKRLEFDLEDHCPGNFSVNLFNDNGNFQTDRRITIKFSGDFIASDDSILNLNIQHISDALKNFNGSGNDLRDTLEALSGDL
jgi:hypothetical protein